MQETNFLIVKQQSFDPLRYLAEVDEQVIWEIYQPALVLAFQDEAAHADLDEGGKETLKRLSFKWLSQRVTIVEQIVGGENAQ